MDYREKNQLGVIILILAGAITLVAAVSCVLSISIAIVVTAFVSAAVVLLRERDPRYR